MTLCPDTTRPAPIRIPLNLPHPPGATLPDIRLWVAFTGAGTSTSQRESMRMQKLTRDSLLRSILPGHLKVLHNSSGAPILPDRAITITHCRELVAIAFAPHGTPIGIDAESASRQTQLERIAPRFLSPIQFPHWKSNLLQAWTLKEAIYKASSTPGWPLESIPLPQPGLCIPAEATAPPGAAQISPPGAAPISLPGATMFTFTLRIPDFPGLISLAIAPPEPSSGHQPE